MSDEAKHIYQTWLDTVSSWLWSGDHTKVADAMAYPQTQTTRDGRLTVHTHAEQIIQSEAFKVSLIRIGATAFHRICNDASFAGSDTTLIVGSHTTYIMKGGTYMTAPYQSEMSLQLMDGSWKGAGNSSDVSNSKIAVFPPSHMMQQLTQAGDTAAKGHDK